jgi:phosphoribosylanthranilate isomerase
LTLDEAAIVLAQAPASVIRVGVFVDAPLSQVVDAVVRLGLDEVQLHGVEDPGYCASVPVPVVKTFRVGPGCDPLVMDRYRGVVEAVLLDTLVEGAAGGSGRTFDWEAARGLPDVAPVYLAGGLRPENVAAAMRTLRVAGVDVSSGVEEAPGIKSEDMLREFIAAVRAADETCKENTA